MKTGWKLFLLALVIALTIIFVLIINTQFKQATVAFNEEMRIQRKASSVAGRQDSTGTTTQVFSTEKQGITVVGATPVENRMSEASTISQEENKGSILPQSQNTASGRIGRQEDLAVPAPGAGITVNKEPTEKEKKALTAKGTIIF